MVKKLNFNISIRIINNCIIEKKIVTEFRAEYTNPEAKRIEGFENFEKNRRGRMAYKPDKDTTAVEGVCKYTMKSL